MTSNRFRVLHNDPDNLGEPLDSEAEELAKVGAEIVPVKCSTEEDVIEAAKDVDGILNIRAPVRDKAINTLERCKAIARYGVGIDTLDPDAATKKGIVIANVPDFCWKEVSNHVMMHLLASAKKLVKLDQWVREGNWGRDFLKPMGSIHKFQLEEPS